MNKHNTIKTFLQTAIEKLYSLLKKSETFYHSCTVSERFPPAIGFLLTHVESLGIIFPCRTSIQPFFSPVIIPMRYFTASIPCFSKEVRTVVIDGLTSRAISMSSHPATLTCSGTRILLSISASTAPIALRSFAAKTASGSSFFNCANCFINW